MLVYFYKTENHPMHTIKATNFTHEIAEFKILVKILKCGQKYIVFFDEKRNA
jgi:hypothetical protein